MPVRDKADRAGGKLDGPSSRAFQSGALGPMQSRAASKFARHGVASELLQPRWTAKGGNSAVSRLRTGRISARFQLRPRGGSMSRIGMTTLAEIAGRAGSMRALGHGRRKTSPVADFDVAVALSSPLTLRPGPAGILYEAADLLRRAALAPDAASVGQAAALLYRAAQNEADRRPRHAAVALAAWDALLCTETPLGTIERRGAFFEVAKSLLAQFISTEDEMALLDRFDNAGLERVPPFEDTLVGEFLAGNSE